jgi:hypothetical protein
MAIKTIPDSTLRLGQFGGGLQVSGPTVVEFSFLANGSGDDPESGKLITLEDGRVLTEES